MICGPAGQKVTPDWHQGPGAGFASVTSSKGTTAPFPWVMVASCGAV